MSKKKPPISQADLDRMFNEQMHTYMARRTAKISSHDNKTFITFAVYDDISGASAKEITKLLDLMRVKYEVFTTYVSINTPEGDDETTNAITIEVEGADLAIADYIQKFIDNNYTLLWQ